MIAVDTNILVYAHRGESPWHKPAAEQLTTLAQGKAAWAIPWPCVYEFFGTVTNPRLFATPTAPAMALEFLTTLLESPTLTLLAEGPGSWERLSGLIVSGRIHGPRVHDARIAALCLVHGVSELLTADRDFGRFPELTVRNPLVG